MSSQPVRHSALESTDRRPAALAVSIEERFPVGMVNLRARDETAMGKALKALKLPPLPEVRRFMDAGARRLLWMAPDEWLLLCDYEEAGDLTDKIDAALADTPHAAVDLSDARTMLRISGDGVRELLMKGAPVDLHPDAFKVGDVRRTQFAEIAAAFWLVEDSPPTFDLVVFRSFGAYVWRFLTESARTEAMPRLF